MIRKKDLFAPKRIRKKGRVPRRGGGAGVARKGMAQSRLGTGSMERAMGAAHRVRKMDYNRRKAETSIVSES